MRYLLAAVGVWTLSAVQAAPPAGALTLGATARAFQPGELVVMTITAPEPAAGIRLRAFGREIPVYRVGPVTWQGLVGIDLAAKPAVYVVSADAKSGARPLHATYSLKVLPRRFPTRVLKVDPALVNPPPEMEERIVREAAEVSRLWMHSAAERFWSGAFVAPVPNTVASQFGARSVYNGQARSPHSGADFPSPIGVPVASPNAGRVVLAKDLYFTGNTVIVDHGLGLFSLLAHLSVIGVHEGDHVDAGQEIGKVGATGRVTGPHLHWAVRAGNARVDPISVLAVLEGETPRPQRRQ
jgi:hypothetical protein